MKNLILILLLMLIVPRGTFAQTATNKVVNTAVIYSANSPFTTLGIINAQSNVFIGTVLEAGTNASAGTSVGTHFLVSSNAGNPVLVLRNYDPTGNAQFYSKTSSGVDAAAIGTERNGSNIIIHAFLNALSYIRLTTQSGSAANEMYIHPTVTTNTGDFVVAGIATFNGAITNSGGAVPSVLSTNVMSDFPLIAAILLLSFYFKLLNLH